MREKIYPLVFMPIYKEKVWGGHRLREILGRDIPAGSLIGESWELVDRPPDSSIVRNGCFANRSLHEVIQILDKNLLGTKHPCDKKGRFPLLIKFLDASKKLSVQVHPTDELAVLFNENDPGKTEMWYVLHAEPNARIIYGCDPKLITKIREKDIDSTIEDLLHSIEIEQGDFIFMPAGQVHTLLGGCVILEIQQNSDVTYRIYDWQRLGLDGTLRELHLPQSLDCINLIKPDNYHQKLASFTGTRKQLVQCPYFAVDYFSIFKCFEDSCTGDTFKIITPVEGAGTLVYNKNESLPLACGDMVLLPATLGNYSIHPKNHIKFLLTT